MSSTRVLQTKDTPLPLPRFAASGCRVERGDTATQPLAVLAAALCLGLRREHAQSS
jgi:hypothetical protein